MCAPRDDPVGLCPSGDLCTRVRLVVRCKGARFSVCLSVSSNPFSRNPDRRRSAWCRQADGMLRGAALVSLTLFAVPTTASPPPPAPLPPPPPLPAPPPLSPGFKCTNTCGGNPIPTGDGRCDDGGPGDPRFWPYPMGYARPACPFGEDCDDCGPRALPPPPAAPPPPPPAPPPWTPGESCSNECGKRSGRSYANNGVCEEEMVDVDHNDGYRECDGE